MYNIIYIVFQCTTTLLLIIETVLFLLSALVFEDYIAIMIYSLLLSLLFVIEGGFRMKVVGIRNISQMDVL